jgi:hypothetical protein
MRVKKVRTPEKSLHARTKNVHCGQPGRRTDQTQSQGDEDTRRPACQYHPRVEDGNNKSHHRVLDHEASPIAALEHKYETLQEHASDHEEFLELLIAVSDTDAQHLRHSLRRGEEIHSLVARGRDMRRTSDSTVDR